MFMIFTNLMNDESYGKEEFGKADTLQMWDPPRNLLEQRQSCNEA